MKCLGKLAFVVSLMFCGMRDGYSQDLLTMGLNGTWQGPIKALQYTDLSANGAPRTTSMSSPGSLKIVIDGSTVHLFIRDTQSSAWEEKKPGEYRISAYKTNGLIYAHQSAQGWVETSAIIVTLVDANHIFAQYSRGGNNYPEAPSAKEGRFFSYGQIVLQREN